jgi:ABC-type glycerol-3-phosphate transport system substrate-binding protein
MTAAALAVGAVACGGGGSSGGNPNAPLIKRFAGQTIRVLMYEQVPTDSTEKRIGEFEKQTGIHVKIQNLAEAQMINKEQLDFSSHTGAYDVTNVHFWYVPQFAQAHHLEPLEKYVRTMSVPRWNSMSDFVPSYLKSMKYQGALYGLPFQGIVGILYYRKDLIAKYCHGKPPATMDELVTCAKAITANGGGKVFGYTDRGSSDEATFMDPAGWVYAWGTPFIDAQGNRSSLDSPQAKAAIGNFVTLLHDAGPRGQAGMGWAEAEQNVLNGVAAMTFDTSDLAADMVDPKKSHVADKIGFAPPPTPQRAAQDFFASGLSINADSQHKGAAWLFVQWATSTAVQREELSERSDFTVQSLLGSKAFRERPGGAVILKAAKMADPAYFPATPKFSAIADAFDPALSDMVAKGPGSVPAAMPKAAAAVNEVLAGG